MTIYRTTSLSVTLPEPDHGLTETSPSRLSVQAEDQDGPIFFLQNTHPAPVFEPDAFWGQYITSQEEGLYLGTFHWEGVKYEHQQAGSVGQIYPHPFWGGIDVVGMEQRCYLQMISAPGTTPEMQMYAPRRWRSQA